MTRTPSQFRRAGKIAIALITLWPRTGMALDQFEIQVYEAEVNRPGQFALELHSNYTFQGREHPDYTGELPPDRVGRFTLEPAIGITDYFELGGYLQTMVSPSEGAQWAGWKLRGKFVVPERLNWPVFVGLNIEVGRVPLSVEEHGWANEFRPIVGYRDGYVLLNFNPIFGYALSGPDRFRPDFEPAGKVAINTQLGFELGVEYYAALGYFNKMSPLTNQEHLVFATFDLAHPAHSTAPEDGNPWELNVAMGRGLTESTGRDWIIKTIVGRAF